MYQCYGQGMDVLKIENQEMTLILNMRTKIGINPKITLCDTCP